MGNWCFKALLQPEDDLFTILPQEITKEILRRLTIRSILRCKCVCQSWRHLIEGVEFATLYTPEQGLAFALMGHEYKVFDEAFKPLLRVSLPPEVKYITGPYKASVVIDSANGLLLVWNKCVNILSISNPMTHEYTVLPPLSIPPPNPSVPYAVILGFGVSKICGQYKILYGTYTYKSRSWSCYVYTLGGRGGSWRSLAVPALDLHISHKHPVAPFLNGNLHWLTSDLSKKELICCFDLETELFTSLSLPEKLEFYSQLRILEDRLCLCSCYNSVDSHIVIWRMNSYGDANSWSKVYTSNNLPHTKGLVFPLKVLANGDLLYEVEYGRSLFICSKSTGIIVKSGFVLRKCITPSNISFYTPGFLSLTAMGIDNVELLNDKVFPYKV